MVFRSPNVSAPPPARHETPRSDASALSDALARCLARTSERMPPELGAALGVLGAQGLVEDACRLDLAPRLGSSALCDAVRSSALRETCLSRVAMALAVPEQCPPTPGLRGRDPVCVAVAARAPALCTAAPGSDRGRCLALARADGRACEALEGSFRETCTQDVTALSPWLRPLQGTTFPDARVVVTEYVPSSDGGGHRSWELRAHRRGQWLDEAGVLHVLDPSETSAASDIAAGVVPVVVLKVPTVSARAGITVSAEARIVLPDARIIDTAEGTARASAVFSVVPHARGDRVVATVTVEGATVGVGHDVTVTVEGFIRDQVPPFLLR